MMRCRLIIVVAPLATAALAWWLILPPPPPPDCGQPADAARSGAVAQFCFPKLTPLLGQGSMTAGPDGSIWFTEGHKIARITPAGALTEFPVPPPDVFITAGPDGNLWFIENDGHVGRITLAGEVKRFPAFEPTIPSAPAIIAGPDGNLWFPAQPGKIGRITPSGAVTLFPLPQNAQVGALAAGPDGRIWFIRSDTAMSGLFWWTQIGRITP